MGRRLRWSGVSPRVPGILVVLLIAACGEGEFASTLPPEFRAGQPSDVKVLLVGIDGASFNVIEPMIAAGGLPQMAALMERGTSARLRSEAPMKSPAIWTTVATGRSRAEHGIEDFMSTARGTPQEPALVASVDRRKLALWNLLGPFDRSVLSVGWWVTWPAEAILGQMVSDRLAHSRWMSWTGAGGDVFLTYPEALVEDLSHLRVDPMDPPLDELDALVELTSTEREEMLAATEPIPYHGPSVLKFGYCEQRTYENVALALLEKGQPDLAMVFLIAVDPICHTFWHYFEPQKFGGGVSASDAARLGSIVPAIYAHDDRTLGRLLERVSDDTVVIVLSDHGFKASGVLPRATGTTSLRMFGIDRTEQLERPVNVGMTGVHRMNGVLIAAGGPIVVGADFERQPTVADVTPTVLALMGLPVARDMSGRVLDEMIDPAFLARHPVRYVDSYEGVIERPQVEVSEEDDELRRSYLRALGYTD